MFGHMKVRTRLLIMMGFMQAAMLVITLFALVNERTTMLEDRKIKTRHLVEVASGVVNHFHALQQSGTLPEEEARKSAVAAVKALRYETDDYFWINDFHPKMVMHPTKPELDGQDLTNTKDPEGTALFVEMAKTVQQQGSGYVFYLWPKPGQDSPVAKVSYVKGFTPWAWIIGSGIYLDDINAIFWNRVWWLLAINLGAAIAIAAGMYVIGRSITRPLETMDAAITRMGEHGDLSMRIELSDRGELGYMGKHLNQTLEQVGSLMRSVLDTAQQVAARAEQLAATTSQLTSGSNAQASAAADMAAAVEQMSVSISEVAANAEAADKLSEESAHVVAHGGEIVTTAANEMSRTSEMVNESARRIMELSERSKQISGIANVINEIANQTNLLALNAAIEAARAGETGRGFAVVADEVRKLAERTTAATAEISALIASIQDNTSNAVSSMQASSTQANKGMALANEAGQAFAEINASSQRTAERVRDISMSSREQNSTSQNIAVNVEKIAQMTEENSSATASVAESADDLKQLADSLMKSVSRFTV